MGMNRWAVGASESDGVVDDPSCLRFLFWGGLMMMMMSFVPGDVAWEDS
jgi:hypothetical protein